MSSRTVLIVGANGFVGSNALGAFVAAGWRVHTFGPRLAVDLLAELRGKFQEHEGSIEDGASIEAALSAAQPGVVVSFAAHSVGRDGLVRAGELEAERSLQVNVLGHRKLFEACRAHGVERVLWASSTTVFGPAECYGGKPVDEESEPQPRTVYGVSKVMTEALARYYRDTHGMEICALRPPLVFGPGRWYGGAATPLMQLFASAATGESIALDVPAESFDLIYVGDLARAFVQLCEHPQRLRACYHVNGFATSYREIADRLSALVPGFQPALHSRASGVSYPLMRAERIAADTGFQPRYDLAGACAAYVAALQRGQTP